MIEFYLCFREITVDINQISRTYFCRHTILEAEKPDRLKGGRNAEQLFPLVHHLIGNACFKVYFSHWATF